MASHIFKCYKVRCLFTLSIEIATYTRFTVKKNNNNRYRNRSLLNIMDYAITKPYEIIYILGEPPHTLLEGYFINVCGEKME